MTCQTKFPFNYNELTYKPEVGNLWLASQMWLFWWRYLARLIFF